MTVKSPVEGAGAIRAELCRITASASFRTSKRSKEFLEYIVLKALDGRFDELKERVIGASLFGRPLDYDTGTDSIVRGIANETRRRLHQFYQEDGQASPVRIELVAGSYAPTMQWLGEPVPEDLPEKALVPSPVMELAPAQIHRRTGRRALLALWVAVTLSLAAACLLLVQQNNSLRRPARDSKGLPAASLPWSALFDGNRGIHIVLADTSVGGVQSLQRSHLPLEDYLNGRFIVHEDGISPEKASFLRYMLGNQFTSASYAITAIRIARLAESYRVPVTVSYARELSLRTFKGGENFVVLGTSRANPWAQLLEPQLNFVLVFGDSRKEPFFRNRAPKPEEASIYVPSPDVPGALRQSYGQIAFLPDLYQGGHILFVTGTSSQATESAGEFVTDLPRLNAELTRAGIRPGSAPKQFEILLQVRHTTGAPVRSEAIAFR